MNILTTCSLGPCSLRQVEVVYGIGVARQGRLKVTVAETVQDREVVAELAALHLLLVSRAVFSEDRAGNALCLTVSSGQIKKLLQRRSSKTHLTSYANFLAVRFADASVTVEQNAPWLKPRADNNVEELALYGDALDDEVLMRPYGRVALTRHCIDQFARRNNAPDDYADSWRQLRLILSNRLDEITMNEVARREKAERHGVEGRLFVHRETGWHFVLTEAPGQPPRLVTAYQQRRRHPSR